MGSSNHLNPLNLPLCTTVYTLAALCGRLSKFVLSGLVLYISGLITECIVIGVLLSLQSLEK